MPTVHIPTRYSEKVTGSTRIYLMLLPLVMGTLTLGLAQLAVRCVAGKAAFAPAAAEVLRWPLSMRGTLGVSFAWTLVPFVGLTLWILVLSRKRLRRQCFLFL